MHECVCVCLSIQTNTTEKVQQQLSHGVYASSRRIQAASRQSVIVWFTVPSISPKAAPQNRLSAVNNLLLLAEGLVLPLLTKHLYCSECTWLLNSGTCWLFTRRQNSGCCHPAQAWCPPVTSAFAALVLCCCHHVGIVSHPSHGVNGYTHAPTQDKPVHHLCDVFAVPQHKACRRTAT